HFPQLPSGNWSSLFTSALLVYALASLSTLLCASALDKMAKTSPHDPNQELIGQGVSNMICACFGGIPIAGVIARSALNYQAGGKTRRSSIIHAIFVLLTMMWFAPFMEMIPITVLAGVLISVA